MLEKGPQVRRLSDESICKEEHLLGSSSKSVFESMLFKILFVTFLTRR